MTHDYSYDNLLELTTAEENPVLIGYGTRAWKFGNAVYLTYQSSPLALVTSVGVRPYPATGGVMGKAFKKRMNAVLKEVGWALVTRNHFTYLLYRPTTEVCAYDGTTMCLPNGDVLEVAVPNGFTSTEGFKK